MSLAMVRTYLTDGVAIRAMASNHLLSSVVSAGCRHAVALRKLLSEELSGFSSCHPPTQAYPLLNVVRQASPQRLASHFLQAPHPKLPQTELSLQPQVAKLGHRTAPPINLACRLRLHLGHEGRHLRYLFRAHQPPSPGSLGTALRPQRTGPTVPGRRLVTMPDHSHPLFLTSVGQRLARRAGVGVAGRLINKGFRTELGAIPRRSKLRSRAACAPASIAPPINSTPRSAVASTVSWVVKPPSATTCFGSRPRLLSISSSAGISSL